MSAAATLCGPPQSAYFAVALKRGDYGCRKRYKKFTKGLGLAAHGVGIGSFVYLRRIFENLIEEAHTATQQDTGLRTDTGTLDGWKRKLFYSAVICPPFSSKTKAYTAS
jgi:hypothetical protein